MYADAAFPADTNNPRLLHGTFTQIKSFFEMNYSIEMFVDIVYF